jgi:uncharacterized damage-inducible protein DinB
VTKTDLIELFEFARSKSLATLDAIAKEPDTAAILAWRPGPGRAHLAWQLMHLGATDDRHLYIRMKGGEPKEPEYVRRFAGGSTPDDNIPTLDEIRRYISARRQEMLDHLRTLDEAQVSKKPNEQAPWTYAEWIRLLAWHEGHHQGQAHLTLNLYKAAHPKG